MRIIRYATVGFALIAATSLAACGGSSSPPSSQSTSTSTSTSTSSSTGASTSASAPDDKVAATAQIKAAYRSFFGANAMTAVHYVEDGPALEKSFGALQKLAGGARITAKVKKV